MKKRYCVASAYISSTGECSISFYAFDNNAPGYGLHKVDDINHPTVIWYDTLEAAKDNILNSTDEFVTSRMFTA